MVEFLNTEHLNRWCLNVDHIANTGLLLNSREKTIEFAQQVCQLLENSGLEQDRAILVDEWHEYIAYLSGLEDLIDSTTNQLQGIINLIKPQNGLIISTAISTARVLHLFPQVDVLNTSATALISKFLDTESINNVTTISFDDFHDTEKKYEFVLCYLGPATYITEFFSTVIDKVEHNGILFILNSSDFSNAYTAPRSPANAALKQLRDTNKFDIVHYPTPVSFTICTRREN